MISFVAFGIAATGSACAAFGGSSHVLAGPTELTVRLWCNPFLLASIAASFNRRSQSASIWSMCDCEVLEKRFDLSVGFSGSATVLLWSLGRQDGTSRVPSQS